MEPKVVLTVIMGCYATSLILLSGPVGFAREVSSERGHGSWVKRRFAAACIAWGVAILLTIVYV